MPLPVIENCFRTISSWATFPGGRPWSVCMDYKADDLSGDAEEVAQLVADAWLPWFNATVGARIIGDQFHTATSLQQVLCYDLSGITAPVVVAPSATTAGDGSVALPADVAMVVSKRTAVRGRQGRGRLYLGGLSTEIMDTVVDGLFLPDVTTTFANNFATNFLQLAGATSNYDMVVISQADVPTGLARAITALTIDVHPDTQRRRGAA